MARGFGAAEGRFAKSYGLGEMMRNYGTAIEASEAYVKYLEKDAGKAIVDALTDGLSDEMKQAVKSDILKVVGMTMKDGRADTAAAREKAYKMFVGKEVNVSEDGKHDGEPDESLDKVVAALKELSDAAKSDKVIEKESLADELRQAVLEDLGEWAKEAYADDLFEYSERDESITVNVGSGKYDLEVDPEDSKFVGVVEVDGRVYNVEVPVKNVKGEFEVGRNYNDEPEDSEVSAKLMADIDMSKATIQYVGPAIIQKEVKPQTWYAQSEIDNLKSKIQKASVSQGLDYRGRPEVKMNMDDVEKLKTAVLNGVKGARDRQPGGDADVKSTAGKTYRHAAVLAAIEAFSVLNDAETKIQAFQEELEKQVKQLKI